MAVALNRLDNNVVPFSPVPEVGVHPRLYFNPEDIAQITSNIASSTVGRAMWAYNNILTGLLRFGATWYNTMPNSIKLMPDGSNYIPNVGLFDVSKFYADISGGTTITLPTMNSGNALVLGGQMALEALYCCLYSSNSDVPARSAALCTAATTLSTWAISQPTYNTTNTWYGGGFYIALIYDFAFNFMTSSQQIAVRKSIAKQIVAIYPQITAPVYIQSGNFVTLDGFQLLTMCAVEGELTVAEDGVDGLATASFFKTCMGPISNYYIYGINPTGSFDDSATKDCAQAQHLIIYAKRGYNFFGSANLRKLGNSYYPNVMYPWGYGTQDFDDNPAGAPNEAFGYLMYNPQDYHGLKHAYPNDLGIDYMWLNTVYNRWNPFPHTLSLSVTGLLTLKANQSTTWTNSFNGGSGNGPFTLVMQDDGDLVIYNKKQVAVWSTDTGTGGTYTNNPASILVSGNSLTDQQTLTSPSGQYQLVVETNGALTLFNGGVSYWSTSTTHALPWPTFIDLRESRQWSTRGMYYPSNLVASIFPHDPLSCQGLVNVPIQKQLVLQGNDYCDTWAAVVVTKSGLGSSDSWLLFHVRQDQGGHCAADRLTFVFAALGRLWIKEQLFSTNQAGMYHNIIQIDGVSMYITPQDGVKHIIPAKLCAYMSTEYACFSTGDASYNYNWQWEWIIYPFGSKFTPASGYTAENNTINTWRRSDNQIVDPTNYGALSYNILPYWNITNGPTYSYGIQRKIYNSTRQVIRTVGLIRGIKAYSLIIDDVVRDNNNHDYTWLGQLPLDLTFLYGTSLPIGCDPTTDIVLSDTTMSSDNMTKSNCCLFRIIRALGTPVIAPTATTGSSLAYVIQYATGMNTMVIERSAVSSPQYLIMMYPFVNGVDPIPTTNLTGNVLTVTISGQVDTITLNTRNSGLSVNKVDQVLVTEPILVRDGVTLLDYTNQIEIFSGV